MIIQKDKDQLNNLSMNMILLAGNAREKIMKALTACEARNFITADSCLQAALSEIEEAHILQTETVQKEAMEQEYYYSMLFTHAQDTLMTIQSEYNIALHQVAILKTYG